MKTLGWHYLGTHVARIQGPADNIQQIPKDAGVFVSENNPREISKRLRAEAKPLDVPAECAALMQMAADVIDRLCDAEAARLEAGNDTERTLVMGEK